ncbi:uncharacterized protein LOC123318585 [Coccinella septempunctata]|uniref:uncharacterized protein LOC123318585 n=1 Tax=Coccinella septempunctata TaxID=41139 RepID=UPI001D08498E|nr:uncharacterized protein LOC123318585 [Coccinella septempunctata]
MNHAQISAGSSTSDPTKQAVPKKRSRTSTKKNQNDFITYCKRQLEKNDSLDEYDAAAISWAKKLKRMNPMQAIYADMHINRIVNLGLLNQLTNNIDFPPQSPIFSSLSSHSGETSNLPYSVQVHPPDGTSDSSQPIQPSGIATYYSEAGETILTL